MPESELLKYLARALVDSPDGVQIEILSDPLMYFGGRQLDA